MGVVEAQDFGGDLPLCELQYAPSNRTIQMKQRGRPPQWTQVPVIIPQSLEIARLSICRLNNQCDVKKSRWRVGWIGTRPEKRRPVSFKLVDEIRSRGVLCHPLPR